MRVLLLIVLSLSLGCKEETQQPSAQPQPGSVTKNTSQPRRFSAEIERFERMDTASPPAAGAVVFVGSSSIRRWSTLAEDMAPLAVLNRGFGGSEFSDVVRYSDRIITNYQPQAIVVYGGDNDLAYPQNGKTPESIAADLETLIARIRAKDKSVPVFVLSIKPSPARLQRWLAMAEANGLMQAYCDATNGLEFIDVASHLFRDDGTLRAEAFVADGVHLSALGYAEWTKRIAPRLSH